MLLVAATALWLSGMAVLTLWSFGTYFLDPDLQHSGTIVINRSTGSIYNQGDWFVGAIIGTLSIGLCCPTIPYAISLVVLAVMHLALPRK
jgi:hypothetical protein